MCSHHEWHDFSQLIDAAIIEVIHSAKGKKNKSSFQKNGLYLLHALHYRFIRTNYKNFLMKINYDYLVIESTDI
jgi:hypothetical protein